MEQLKDTSAATQRAKIKAYLRIGSHSTLEFRQMGICSPAPRIKELRKQGYQISTSTRTEIDHAGVTHKGIAVYTLLSEPEQSAS